MARKFVKWVGLVILISIIIGVTYLSVKPDPGPYIVALRSDTPDQVSKALDAILAGDTLIHYDGNTYPPLTIEQLQVIGMRLFGKATGQAREPLQGDTAAWMGFANRVATGIQTRIHKP